MGARARHGVVRQHYELKRPGQWDPLYPQCISPSHKCVDPSAASSWPNQKETAWSSASAQCACVAPAPQPQGRGEEQGYFGGVERGAYQVTTPCDLLTHALFRQRVGKDFGRLIVLVSTVHNWFIIYKSCPMPSNFSCFRSALQNMQHTPSSETCCSVLLKGQRTFHHKT